MGCTGRGLGVVVLCCAPTEAGWMCRKSLATSSIASCTAPPAAFLGMPSTKALWRWEGWGRRVCAKGGRGCRGMGSLGLQKARARREPSNNQHPSRVYNPSQASPAKPRCLAGRQGGTLCTCGGGEGVRHGSGMVFVRLERGCGFSAVSYGLACVPASCRASASCLLGLLAVAVTLDAFNDLSPWILDPYGPLLFLESRVPHTNRTTSQQSRQGALPGGHRGTIAEKLAKAHFACPSPSPSPS